MADAPHNPSRRACPGLCRREVLGAAVGLPVAVVAGSSPLPALRAGPSTALHAVMPGCDLPPAGHSLSGGKAAQAFPQPAGGGTEGRWSLLVAAVDEAWAAVGALERGMKGLAFAEAEARQGEYDAVSERFEAALGRLLRAPAPDAAGFARKIVLAIDHDPDGLFGGEACRRALRRDALRLCSGQAQRFSVKAVP